MSGPFPHKSVRDARRLRTDRVGPAAQSVEEVEQRKDDELKLAKSFRNVYGTPDGMIVLEHIMTHLCSIDQPIVAPEVRSTESLIARCTARDLGHEIHRLINRPIEERKEQPKVNTEAPNV
jgi:hypothetical protein